MAELGADENNLAVIMIVGIRRPDAHDLTMVEIPRARVVLEPTWSTIMASHQQHD